MPISLPPIPGLSLRNLVTHADSRGSLTEIFRAQWSDVPQAVQWNLSSSCANVLRGVHVHRTHSDYLIVSGGRLLIGVSDLRPGHPRNAGIVELRADAMQALVIPPHVAHGFYSPEASNHIYGVTHYWDPADELGCRWNDPALEIPWPAIRPDLSPRDAELGNLADLLVALAA